jgi:predicted metal-binding protein
MTKHVLFVCKSCGFSLTQRDHLEKRGGEHLLQHLLDLQEQWHLQAEYLLQSTTCLSACDRRCVVALSAPNKMTLMFGDLPPLESAVEILQLAEQYYRSSDGIVPRQERPEKLKKGILARIPPLPSE